MSQRQAQPQKGRRQPAERAAPDGGATAPALSAAPYVVTVSLAAFLLFSLELLASRLLLPVFGGAPAVWTTSLCFFTAVLSIGYGYAHLVATRLSMRRGAWVQATLAVAAVVLTVVAPRDLATLRFDGLSPALNILVALSIVAGPAALVLASSTPLFSAWYAGGRGAPWWLYAVSNAASFAALLAYPFAIAPALSLSTQRVALSIGLIAYAAGLAIIVWQGREEAPTPAVTAVAPESLGWSRQAGWLFAAAVPAGLMAATTNFIQTDLIAAPLIWIGPLGVYLASFVVAFSRRGERLLPIVERLAPAAATLLWMPFIQGDWPIATLLAIELAALFVVAIAIHGRLVRDRPAEAHLTRFYLLLSLGGLLGTAFVALIAPAAFRGIYEYPILIVAAVVALAVLPGPFLAPGLKIGSSPARAVGELAARLTPFVVLGLALQAKVPSDQPVDAERLSSMLVAGGAVVAAAMTSQVTALLTPAVILFMSAFHAPLPAVVTERTFFGVTRVVEEFNARTEYSGTTVHGLQFTDERRREPTMYYAEAGPLGAVFADLRGRTAGAAIGVVGLGVGTIAAYARPGDQLTFFEIDPAVIEIANDAEYFTYFEDAAVVPRVVEGDGRLSLRSEPDGSLDLLVLDAFTSDVVPAHLLTREAIEEYQRKLRPGAVMAFHLSSRYYRLTEPVAATARVLGLESAGRSSISSAATDRTATQSSLWIVVGRRSDVARFQSRRWGAVPTGGVVLTDDHSDLTRLLTRSVLTSWK